MSEKEEHKNLWYFALISGNLQPVVAMLKFSYKL